MAALCEAARTGRQESYPVKTRRLKRGRREHVWLLLCWQERIWLVQRPESGIWGGLRSLPEFASVEEFDAATATWPGEGVSQPSFTHTLTHLDWTLHPVRWTLPADAAEVTLAAITGRFANGRWFGVAEALAEGLPAPLRKLLLQP